MHRTILHIDMNAFFASVEQAVNPALRGKPIAIVGSKERTVVLPASYAAKRFGVKTGSTIYEAKKTCPGIIFVTTDTNKYMDTSREIMKLLKAFTPIVEVCSIDEAFLDITGSFHLFPSAENIAQLIKKEIRTRFNITCSIGIAPNKSLSKLAANMKKPDGLVIILPESLPEFMIPVQVDKICGIGPHTTEFFHERGIYTCGQLQKIPLSYLKNKFGVMGEWLHEVAFGRDNSHVISSEDEPMAKSVGHSMTLKTDAKKRAEVEMHLKHLSEMVGRRLRSGILAGKTASVQIRFSSFYSVCKRKTFYIELYTGKDIFYAAKNIWKDIPMNEPVRLVGVSVSNLYKRTYQIPLFKDEQRKMKITIASDKVNNQFGEFTVYPASLLERNKRERTIAPSWRPAS